MDELLSALSLYHLINTVALGVMIYVCLQRRKVPVLFWLLFFLFLVETICCTYYLITHKNNHLAYNVVMHGTIVFYYLVLRSSRLRFFYDSLFAFWALGSIAFLTFFIGWSHVSLGTYIVGYALVLVKTLDYFNQKIFHLPFESLEEDYRTWFALGLGLFFTCSFPMILNYFKLVGYLNSYNHLLGLGNIILSLGYLSAAIVYLKFELTHSELA